MAVAYGESWESSIVVGNLWSEMTTDFQHTRCSKCASTQIQIAPRKQEYSTKFINKVDWMCRVLHRMKKIHESLRLTKK